MFVKCKCKVNTYLSMCAYKYRLKNIYAYTCEHLPSRRSHTQLHAFRSPVIICPLRRYWILCIAFSAKFSIYYRDTVFAYVAYVAVCGYVCNLFANDVVAAAFSESLLLFIDIAVLLQMKQICCCRSSNIAFQLQKRTSSVILVCMHVY